MKQKIYQNSIDYILITFFSICFLALIRFMEFLIIGYYGIHDVFVKTLFENSINLDAYFSIVLSVIFIVPYQLLSLKYPKLSLILYKITWIFTILITICLTHFFISGEYLLSNVIFQFSFQEIWHIATIESETNHKLIWFMYFIIPISVYLFFFLKNPQRLNKWIKIAIIGIYIIAVFVASINYKYFYKPSYKFSSQFEFYISNNKITHFVKSVIKPKQYESDLNSKDLVIAIQNFHSVCKDFDFESSTYPLLHNESYENVLGKYFKTSAKAPNVVFIISEGLGSAFAGLHPSTCHLLPFVDSLASNGLYWENFLSNCCRTYGVLPNVFGSLISGTLERGFVNYNGEELYGKRYPNNNSLIKELKRNNYFTSFFYGGWGAFDSYQNFLEDQKIDLFIDQSKIDSVKYIAPWKRTPEGFYWGYDDKALFNQWFDYEEKNKVIQPYLSIYMTLNMHEPYNICPQKYYEDQFVKSRLKKLKLENSPFKNKDNYTLGSLFFYEDALRDFFNEYKKRDDYNNTIFIIFGDHYSLMSFLNNPLGIYHVPLIIYSPLIKEHAIFKGVSTHLDIAPSLIALLQGNYGLNFNNEKQWLGTGLDTSSTFRCNRIAPFNLYSSDYPHFLYHDYFLTQDAVIKISDGLSSEVVTDTAIINMVNKFARDFKAIDNYVCKKDKIWRN